MSKDEKFWDALSDKYDKQVEKVFCNAYNKLISYTKNYVKATDIVLDIGCGTGIATVELANDVKELKFKIEQSENLHTTPPNYFIVGHKSQLDRELM